MSCDESVYPNPSIFDPDRFLDKSQADPRNMVFGFGRRYVVKFLCSCRYSIQSNHLSSQCPGNELADRSIFLLVTNIAATMDIGPVKDLLGGELTPEPKFTSGFVRCGFYVHRKVLHRTSS